jgi:selenocysteine lyase/cysteine desulfurase
MATSHVTRRDFARLFGIGGSAALLAPGVLDAFQAPALPATPARPGPSFWQAVRAQFPMPPELAVMNAANLCPSPVSVLRAVNDYTHRLDRQPVPAVRAEMVGVKEVTRKLVARHLHVTPEEIVLTRNTSESNNLVSSGLDLKAGDEVLLFGDNHPSNLVAWQQKAKRFGFTVSTVAQVNPHPGGDYYLDAFAKAITPRTRVLGFTHLTNTVGDLLPARELCRLARDRGVLTLVDGAQTFGLLDVDLSDMQPDFYSGSAHKWPCGPKEVGVLYVNARSQDRIWPSIYSVLPGEVGASRRFEGFGQRDEPALHACGVAMELVLRIGQAAIEAYSRELGRALIEGLRRMDGVRLWTSPDPSRSVSVVSFQPGSLDPAQVLDRLAGDGIVGAARTGTDRPGIRLCPHFYNSHADVERALSTIHRYLR